ncbi:MAG: adenylyltransferase/cytidyltransferase family protein [bacterium]|nr:adenylyltransferase/cytidyltransferase family protein [bacterium]
MAHRKIKSPIALKKILGNLKKQNKKIVFARGCFDFLHPGHIDYLTKAKAQGDILVVWVNTDQSVRTLKSESRPINNLDARMMILANLETVDFISFFKDKEGLEIVKKFKPDIVAAPRISPDYAKAIQDYGGKIAAIPVLRKYSTSQIIKKILKNYGSKEKKCAHHRQ